MKFADALASSIHDIKNALGMVINTLEEISADPHSGLASNPKAITLQLEARRANSDLIQLLTLYKLENERITPHIAEQNLEDYLDDFAAEYRSLAESRGIDLETDCDPLLSAYFDADLVRGVLNNAIDNAQRYTRDRILLAAAMRDDYLEIPVEDNGAGFPQAMLDLSLDPSPSEGFSGGRTQLGLYFAQQVAQLHRNGERGGHIRLSNDCSLGGGCFSILLP
jgi:signal transduction histidine kinase